MKNNEIRISTVAGNRMERPGWWAAAAAAIGLALLLSIDVPSVDTRAAKADCEAQSQRTMLAQPVNQCTECGGSGPRVNFMAGC